MSAKDLIFEMAAERWSLENLYLTEACTYGEDDERPVSGKEFKRLLTGIPQGNVPRPLPAPKGGTKIKSTRQKIAEGREKVVSVWDGRWHLPLPVLNEQFTVVRQPQRGWLELKELENTGERGGAE